MAKNRIKELRKELEKRKIEELKAQHLSEVCDVKLKAGKSWESDSIKFLSETEDRAASLEGLQRL